MRYLPSTPCELVSSSLNFNTSDCNVTGACELYSIKSSSADKRLLREIDQALASQHDTILQNGAAMWPAGRASLLASSPMLRLFEGTESAFGPLREVTNRRTFALLIATLNASHAHYDFSKQLRPASFHREPDHDQLAAEFGSALRRFRHSRVEGDFAVGGGFAADGDTRDPYDDGIRGPRGRASPIWGRHCWREIDKEMRLSGCEIFRFNCPGSEDPLCDDVGAIWTAHYFIYSRPLRRIAYLYARAAPVTSSRDRQHPVCRSLTSTDGHGHGAGGGAGKRARIASASDDRQGAQKRARYWLGDRDPSLIEVCDHDDDDEASPHDGFRWNRHPNGDLIKLIEYEEAEQEEDENVFSDERYGLSEDDEEAEEGEEEEVDEEVFSDQGYDLYDGDEEPEEDAEAEAGDDDDKGGFEDGAA